jgi:hypothetical protein
MKGRGESTGPELVWAVADGDGALRTPRVDVSPANPVVCASQCRQVCWWRFRRKPAEAMVCLGAGSPFFAEEQPGVQAVISSWPEAHNAMATARAERRPFSPTHRRGST